MKIVCNNEYYPQPSLRPVIFVLTIGSILLFFRFEHRKTPVHALGSALIEMGRHESRGKFLHIKMQGEAYHYFGHTDSNMMTVLREALNRRSLSFTEIEESALPVDKREFIAAARAAGALG